MASAPTSGGLGTKEALLALAVIVIFAAIIIPLALRTENKNLLLNESSRMRQLYVGLSMYEEQAESHPAPSLISAARFDVNKNDYLSSEDPFSKVKADAYPADPGLSNGEISPFRISFSYLMDFARAGKIALQPWTQVRMNPAIGLLADEWIGSVRPGQPFEAQVSGRLLRVNTDGSVTILKDRGGPKPLGDAQDLFIRR